MRLWGWENGAPCAFKEKIAAPASAATGISDAWDTAPPCKSANTSAVLDGSNRLWGWENGASCAFKAPGDGGDAVWEVSEQRLCMPGLLQRCAAWLGCVLASPDSVQLADMTKLLLWPALLQAAKPCSMVATADNIKAADNRNRKWGWENGAACAFKVGVQGCTGSLPLAMTNAAADKRWTCHTGCDLLMYENPCESMQWQAYVFIFVVCCILKIWKGCLYMRITPALAM
eukprot:GHRQ01035848.1.p1 GENE.GHRQ01035848.1~~GHRQ01035848.1.p1  ORF type:complete len:230 (-),score=40.34 GHRQ01035848.1:48-737(-)